MNWYSEYQNQWKEIIETVARECKRSEFMVEKDTVQSMFLLELSKVNLPFVFKGGTSLSKAYNLINRFSEDIDLSMNRKPTQSERKASKKSTRRSFMKNKIHKSRTGLLIGFGSILLTVTVTGLVVANQINKHKEQSDISENEWNQTYESLSGSQQGGGSVSYDRKERRLFTPGEIGRIKQYFTMPADRMKLIREFMEEKNEKEKKMRNA